MEGYENIVVLIDDIESILDELLMSGIGSINHSTVDEIKRASNECKRFGLLFATHTLDAIGIGLEEKRHSLQYNDSHIIQSYFLLNSYINILKGRMGIENLNKV